MTGNLVKDNKCFTKWRDGGWKTLSISGTGITAGSVTPKYRVINDRIYIRGTISADMSTASLPVKIAELPEGARPAEVKYELIAGEGDRMARLYVNTSGEVYLNYFKTYAGESITSGTYWVQIDTDFFNG